MSNPRASNAVGAAIRKGRLRPLASLTCVDCDAPAMAYDHYKGYERKHWLDVEPVCDRCNMRRAIQRPARKSEYAAILLRLTTELIAVIDDEAREERRSRNAQIEWILRERYRARGIQLKEDATTYFVEPRAS